MHIVRYNIIRKGKENRQNQREKDEMKENKKIFAEVRKMFKQIWKDDAKMVQWSMHTISQLVRIENGIICVIPKKDLQKRFCFGYGMQCGTSYEEAADKAAAAKSAEYFKNENMKEYRDCLEWMNGEADPFYKKKVPILLQVHGINLYELVFIRVCELLEDLGGSAYLDQIGGTFYQRMHCRAYIPTKEDCGRIREALKEAARAHERKIDAYLKRYGVSKIYTWSYWADA